METLDPGFLAGLDVLDLEISSIGDNRDCLDIENILCRFGGLCQQTHVENLVGDLLFNDQFVLHVDRNLNVVADANMRERCHGTAIGIGQGDLICSGSIQLCQHVLASRPSRADRGDLLGQVLDP